MRLLKITTLVAICCIGLNAYAQHEEVVTATHNDTILDRGEHNVGWLRSNLMDNWYVGLQGGGQLYYGFEDREGSFGDRLTGNIEVTLGRWLFPMVGLRGDIGFGNSHGFITKDNYRTYRDDLIGNGGYGHCYGSSTSTLVSGSDVFNGSLGGYYWPVDGNDDLFMQKWKYVYGGFDVMVNLTYLKQFDRVDFSRRWNNIVYLGFGMRVGMSEENPERFSNFIGYNPDNGSYVNTNFAAEGRLGYIGSYKLTKHWKLQTEVRLSLLEGLFDREKLPGVEAMSPDWNLNVMVGAMYNFNLRSDKARRLYYIDRGILPYDVDEIPEFITYVQVEDVDIIKIIDTLLIYHVDTIDDVLTLTRIDSLQGVLDSLLRVARNVPEDTPLDSILLKQLLPYEMVFFDLDKWDIRPTEEMKIAKMARIMKAYPDQTFILYGSADSHTGTVNRNNFLSHSRADIVYSRLVVDYNIPPSQLRREYLGGIDDYDPFILNRTTVIIMDHPAVQRAFNEMKSRRKAGGNVIDLYEH